MLFISENRWLAYLTGGVAMAPIKYTSLYSDDNIQPGFDLPGALGVGQTSKTKYGWTLGAGGEYALNDTWSLDIKYLYSSFGTIRTSYLIVPTPTLSEFSSAMNGTADLSAHSVLAGLNYRF
jgi:outer membrane immunogenic protein